MTRGRLLFFLASAVVVLVVIGGNMMSALAQDDDGPDSLYKYLGVFSEVLGLVQQAYVEEISGESLMEGALYSATEAVDQFTLFVPAPRVEAFLVARERGDRFSGLTLLKDRGFAFVATVAPGSPAAEAGLEVGDVVTEIDGEPTRPMPAWKLQEVIDRQPGAVVKLEILRQGERDAKTLAFAAFAPPPAGLAEVEGASLLSVGSFRSEDLEALRTALVTARQRGIDALLLDLRGVAGGDAANGYRAAELWTDGELGKLDRRGRALETFAFKGEPLWRGRLVVLVDRGTRGAAEVLATVLDQKLGAALVGERTFGHAGRQASLRLPSGGQLHYTEAFYTGPDGAPLNRGLEPDVRVGDRLRGLDDGELGVQELILREALKVLRSAPAPAREQAA